MTDWAVREKEKEIAREAAYDDAVEQRHEDMVTEFKAAFEAGDPAKKLPTPGFKISSDMNLPGLISLGMTDEDDHLCRLVIAALKSSDSACKAIADAWLADAATEYANEHADASVWGDEQ
jgi:hypothetical protein